MEPIQILELIKEDIRDKFDGDPLMMRTMNLVITEYKARSERLHKPVVSSKQPICQCGQNSLPYEAIHTVTTCSRCGAACAHAKGG